MTMVTPLRDVGYGAMPRVGLMGVRNAKQEGLNRLSCKTLDAQFETAIRDGLNGAPFEADGVLQIVHEVYGTPLGPSDSRAWPGQVTLVPIDAEEPTGKPEAECEQQTIRLTVRRGATDERCLQEKNPAA